MMHHKLKDATQLLYEGSEIAEGGMVPEAPPIYHSTAYIMEEMDDYDKAARGKKYFYGRTANPNRDGLAKAISFLENSENTIVCSSGMAAISTAILTFVVKGSYIIASKSIYGETIELMNNIIKKFGIEITYVDFIDSKEVAEAIKENTVIIYTEIIANPLITVVDIEEIVKIAHEKGVMVMVDSRFTTPFVIKPLDFGVDIVIHSLTKYFNGHSDVTGGSITASKQLIDQMTPVQLLLGGCADPNSSWLALRSMRTMDMRVKTQLKNAEKLALALSKNANIKYVNHPSLVEHQQHELAKRIFTNGYGAMVSFRVEDSRDKVNEFMHRLKLVKYLGTLGGYRTTIAHPATAFRTEFYARRIARNGYV